MLDNGFPLATEVSVLKELIKPPNLYRKVHNLVTGDTKYDIPIFRGTDTSLVDYCIEELDAIIDKNGSTITCEIQGYVINALDMILSQNLVSFFFFKFLMSD